MGYFIISPETADKMRARHEAARKESVIFGAVFAVAAVLGLVAIIVVSLAGWDAKFSILGALSTFILGAAAFAQYVGARDARELRDSVKSEWFAGEPRVGERV